MNLKITKEQFDEYKARCNALMKENADIYEKNKDNPDFNSDELVNQLISKYLEVQNELLKYDLSSIPASAWEDFMIFADRDNPVDLSSTHANIDFSVFRYMDGINFKGCNIKNLKSLNRILKSKDFDQSVIDENREMFVSDLFSQELQQKLFNQQLSIKDLFSLSVNQINELRTKNFMNALEYHSRDLIEFVGLDNLMQLYASSKQDFQVVSDLFFNSPFPYTSPLQENYIKEAFKTINSSEIKKMFYKIERDNILSNDYVIINPEKYPELFVKENDDIFKLNVEMSNDLRQKYYEKKLTFDDIKDNVNLFKNILLSNFINSGENTDLLLDFKKIITVIGDENTLKMLEIYPEVFNYIIKGGLADDFSQYLEVIIIDKLELNKSANTKEELEKILHPFFVINNEITNINQLMLYDFSLFQLSLKQQRIFQTLGLENIKRFEKELGFFSHKKNTWSKELENLCLFGEYFADKDNLSILFDFKNGTLAYNDFVDEIARCLDSIRGENYFIYFQDYDWIQGEFRNQHPEIFMDREAPVELIKLFYKSKIEPELIQQYPEYKKYLLDKNLSNTIKADISLNIKNIVDADKYIITRSTDFIKEYTKQYGNDAFLELCSKYGSILSSINITLTAAEMKNRKIVDKKFSNLIADKILRENISIEKLKKVPEFVAEYPDMFVDFSSLNSIPDAEKQLLTTAFYERKLEFDDLKKYPELVTALKDKNLLIGFGQYNQNEYNDLELLKVFGNDRFLELCTKYGRYMEGVNFELYKYLSVEDGYYVSKYDERKFSFDDIESEIKKYIVSESFSGNIDFNLNDAPEFLVQSHPELFLSKDAPSELQDAFYNVSYNQPFTFQTIKAHKDWLPFLEGKAVSVALCRQNQNKSNSIREYFRLFGEKALQIGLNKTETVERMIESNQVFLMEKWYEKTGRKFIPDYVVMQDFPIDQADKFLLAGSSWSSLMKITSFSSNAESRDAMLKLAYSFGVFDHDQRGFKKLQELLTGLPKHVSSNYSSMMNSIYILEDQVKTLSSINFKTPRGYDEYLELKEALIKEGFKLDDEQELFSQVYEKNDDDTSSLIINPQNYPNSTKIIRNIMGKYPYSPILTPDKAHQLFGGFVLKYDADFRELLLKNMDKILENPEYVSSVASIQKQFDMIKTMNSNRTLTWDLAISFVQMNRFSGVDIGNEGVAEISSIAGYTQQDFETLQQIYNYGKQRTFSSIPRIEKNKGKYHYETLRLDNPLAMAIGTLTDCCQELGNFAEVCMEHSMVDKNGRVFVVKDEEENIVSQSWVWRNKDVLCFDNIEIPARAFSRAFNENPDLGRKKFTNEVFQIYKQAAKELMQIDETEYKKLLEEGKITQKQYGGLRLGKVTVGLGYNDIAELIQKNLNADEELVRPLPFEEPVKLARGLYTNDSLIQYVLDEREDRKKYSGETLPVYYDTYVEYDDNSFTEKNLLSLEKLEIITKQNTNYINTQLSNYDSSEHIVSSLARNYELNPSTTRIIMNPNFAIIYDVNGDQLKIGDLLYNTVIDNGHQQMNIEDKVIVQLGLALEQITKDKQIDVSSLNDSQSTMYSKATKLTEKIDNERGVGHAR